MNNKQECLDYLAKVEKEINSNRWEARVEEPDNLIDGRLMMSYMKGFNLPEPEYIDSKECLLPADWLADEDYETSADYKEVACRFLEVYNLLRYEASREAEALLLDEQQHIEDLHRDYWRAVL